jgi:DNA-binding MarR family transcriptional regulator
MPNETPKQRRVSHLIELFRANGNQDNAFDNLAAELLGVSRGDLDCLNIIERRGGVTAGELAKESGLTTGAVTGVIDRLERAGYARRTSDQADRRKVVIEVTPEFYERAERIWGPMAREWRELISRRFTSEQLDLIADFLQTTTEIGRRHMNRLGESQGVPPTKR